MSDVPSWITAIATFIGASAGLSAVRKWRHEEFEKKLIILTDELYLLEKNCLKQFDEIERKRYFRSQAEGLTEEFYDFVSEVKEPLQSFLAYKMYQLINMEDQVAELRGKADEVIEYGGGSRLFVSRYIFSLHFSLKKSLEVLAAEKLSDVDVNARNAHTAISKLNASEYSQIQKVYSAGSMRYSSKAMGEDKKSISNKLRVNQHMRYVSMNYKRYVYAGYLGKLAIKLKLFLLVNDLKGAVVFYDGVRRVDYITRTGYLSNKLCTEPVDLESFKKSIRGRGLSYYTKEICFWVKELRYK